MKEKLRLCTCTDHSNTDVKAYLSLHANVKLSCLPTSSPAAASPVVRGFGGVTDVLMRLRFLIASQPKAPFAIGPR